MCTSYTTQLTNYSAIIPLLSALGSNNNNNNTATLSSTSSINLKHKKSSSNTSSSAAAPPTHSPPSRSGRLPSPPEFANAYQLDIISALKGNDQNFGTRTPVVEAILAIKEDEQRRQLIEFLADEQGAIALTLQNNACKMFGCTPSELFIVAERAIRKSERSALRGQLEFLEKLAQLFQTTIHKIIPNTIAMLYPLQAFDENFQLRKIILLHFRDRVLLALLDNFRFENLSAKIFKLCPDLEAIIRQMFFSINVEVRDDSDEKDCFDQIFDDFIGNEHINKITTTRDDFNDMTSGMSRLKLVRKVGHILHNEANNKNNNEKQIHLQRAKTAEDSIFSQKSDDETDLWLDDQQKEGIAAERKISSPCSIVFVAAANREKNEEASSDVSETNSVVSKSKQKQRRGRKCTPKFKNQKKDKKLAVRTQRATTLPAPSKIVTFWDEKEED